MNRTVSIVKMHMRDKFSWLVLPWLICLVSFVVNLIVGGTVNPEGGIYTGGVSSLYIYLFVLGLIIVPQTFPFALGMGVRRRDYVAGTLATFIGLSAGSTVLLLLLSEAENSWLAGWGVGLHFFHLPFVHEGALLLQAFTHFTLLLFMFCSGFFIASIYRRFGRTGMYAFSLAAFLIFGFTPLLISYYDRWDDIGRWVEANVHTLNDLTPWLLILVVLLALGSFGMLRRSTV